MYISLCRPGTLPTGLVRRCPKPQALIYTHFLGPYCLEIEHRSLNSLWNRLFGYQLSRPYKSKFLLKCPEDLNIDFMSPWAHKSSSSVGVWLSPENCSYKMAMFCLDSNLVYCQSQFNCKGNSLLENRWCRALTFRGKGETSSSWKINPRGNFGTLVG